MPRTSTKPELNLIPDYVVRWSNSSGTHYLDIKKGKEVTSNQLPDDKRFISNRGDIYYQYIKCHTYNSGKKLLEWTLCKASTRVSDPKPWVKYETFYMDEDRNFYKQDGRKMIKVFDKNNAYPDNPNPSYYYTDHYRCKLDWVKNGKEFVRLALKRMEYSKSTPLMKEFKDFWGQDEFYLQNGRVIQFESLWSLQHWYESSAKKIKTKSKVEDIIDDLAQLELPVAKTYETVEEDRVGDSSTHYGYNPSSYRNDLYNYMVYQKINNEIGVLRFFKKDYHYTYNQITGRYAYTYDDEPYEDSRVYFDFNGKMTRCVAVDSTGALHKKDISSMTWGYKGFFANPEDIGTEKRISFLKGVIEKVKHDGRCPVAIVNMLRYPEIEQLFKMGYIRTALSIGSSRTCNADLKNLFITYNKKGKNLVEKSGLSAKWLKLYLDNFSDDRTDRNHSYSKDIFDTYINLWGTKNVPEKEKFDLMMSVINKIQQNYYYRYNSSFETRTRFIIHALTDAYPDGVPNEDEKELLRKFFNNAARLTAKAPESAQLIKDTIQTWENLNDENRVVIDWMFDSPSDVIRAHDAVTALLNEQRAAARREWDMAEAERNKMLDERRKKLDEKRKKWEYEDDDYIIRLPKDNAEIVREGSIQRICIGGYTSNHSNGNTNLFFLRRKGDNEDIPFYAIEVNNAGVTVQIHGMCNRWLGNNPEAIPTVIRFMRQNGFRCTDEILTCTSAGYGQTRTYCEMPEVDGRKGV